MVAKGEIPIGISFGYRAAQLKEKTPALDIVFPKEGLGWDVEAAAILGGVDNLNDAKRLMDWAASEKANRVYAEFAAVVARRGLAKPLEHRPSWVDDALISNDFNWAASHYERVLGEWTRRYDGKSKVEFNY